MRAMILQLSLLLCLLVPVIVEATELPTPPKGIRIYDVGMAPAFELNDIDGEPISLTDHRGRWVFLHFWASWCGPCREEMPTINELASRYDEDKLKIIMVNTAEDEDTIFSFTSEVSMELPNYMDRDGSVTELYKPRGLPTSFLIDPSGMLRYQAIGGREWHQETYLQFLNSLTN